jgi:hypothetical protein
MKKELKLRIIFLSVLLMTSSVWSNSPISSSCQFELSHNVCSIINFKGPIGRKADAKFGLEFVTKDGSKIKSLDQDPEVVLWMVMKNGHEHGSDKVKIEKAKTGGYAISNVWFLMLGEWQIKLKGKHQGKEFSGSVPVCLRKNIAESAIGKCQ